VPEFDIMNEAAHPIDAFPEANIFMEVAQANFESDDLDFDSMSNCDQYGEELDKLTLHNADIYCELESLLEQKNGLYAEIDRDSFFTETENQSDMD
jgi:hypothetical protein